MTVVIDDISVSADPPSGLDVHSGVDMSVAVIGSGNGGMAVGQRSVRTCAWTGA
jgi:hypothetical protein